MERLLFEYIGAGVAYEVLVWVTLAFVIDELQLLKLVTRCTGTSLGNYVKLVTRCTGTSLGRYVKLVTRCTGTLLGNYENKVETILPDRKNLALHAFYPTFQENSFNVLYFFFSFHIILFKIIRTWHSWHSWHS
jgi:ABC-type glucose/galactose transport system permease subunit